MQILFDVAEVRKYGNDKYGSPDNWKQVAPKRYVDAMLRLQMSSTFFPGSESSFFMSSEGSFF
jgi:hypothetical protein